MTPKDHFGYNQGYNQIRPSKAWCRVASLIKLTVTRWIDPKTKARVPAGTARAKKVKEKTDCYYIVDKSGGKVRRMNTGCTDYRAAQAALTKYHTAEERGEQGLTDPFKSHLDRLVLDHLTDYVATVRESSRYAPYPRTIEPRVDQTLQGRGDRRTPGYEH